MRAPLTLVATVEFSENSKGAPPRHRSSVPDEFSLTTVGISINAGRRRVGNGERSLFLSRIPELEGRHPSDVCVGFGC